MKATSAFFFLVLGLSAGLSFAADKPNFIIFFTDDMGYGDVGCYGGKTATPNMDRMAAEGTRFTSFYAQNVCGPSRAALLTGGYPIRCAEPGNRKNPHTVLHPRETTIAELLKQQGYATGCIGKWHVAGDGDIHQEPDGRLVYGSVGRPGGTGPFAPALMPNAQGFDFFFGTPMHNGFTRLANPDRFVTQHYLNDKLVDPAADVNQLTRQNTDQALRFIEQNKGRPFFLYLAHNMPHVTLGVSDKFRGNSGAGLYADVIRELDSSLGEIFQSLKQNGLDEKTLILFTSDNGPWIESQITGKGGDDAHHGSAGPLRGGKMTSWEGGSRVPGLLRWPGHVPAGRVSGEIVATLDLLPTFVSLAGGKIPADLKVDGLEMSAFWLGQTDRSPRDTFFHYSYTHLQAVRVGEWKLILPRPANPPWTSWYGRMIEEIKTPRLYNLETDIGEKQDVAAQHPEIVERLTRKIAEARSELGDYNRIGSGARFFDPDPRRPEAEKWK